MSTKVCERCDKEMRLVPAGVSKKTGKPYSAFWSCDSRSGGCGNTARGEEGDASQAPGPVTTIRHQSPTEQRIAALEAQVAKLTEIVDFLQNR